VTRAIFEIVRWIIVSPILLGRFILHAFRWFDFWTLAYRHEIPCRNCGAAISLVGLWQCKCGYTYQGHLLRSCPVCDGVPRMARCFECGVTEELPKP
jgi:hypothetical protein